MFKQVEQVGTILDIHRLRRVAEEHLTGAVVTVLDQSAHGDLPLTSYLWNNKAVMSRTTLRYAIEHYPEPERKAFLAR